MLTGRGRLTAGLVLVAVVLASIVLTAAARPLLAAADLAGNNVFLLVVTVVVALPGLLILGWLGRGLVPMRLVALAASLGVGPATLLAAVVGSIGAPADQSGTVSGLLLANAVLPPIIEELVKALAAGLVLALFVERRRLSRRHGLVLGAAVGLGFLAAEAAWYATVAIQGGGAALSSNGQLVFRFAVLGLSGHTIASALAGVGMAELLADRASATSGHALRARIRPAAPFLAAAVLLHALVNSLGALILAIVVGALAADAIADLRPAPIGVVWIGAVVSIIGAQWWAFVILARTGLDRRPIVDREPPRAPAGTVGHTSEEPT